MNDERWENLTSMIAGKFEIEDEYIEEISEEDGSGKIDVVICNTPAGKIKLERYVKPLVLGKKTFYSKRGGSDSAVEYLYSKNETTQSLKLHKWNDIDNEWEEIKEDNVSALLD